MTTATVLEPKWVTPVEDSEVEAGDGDFVVDFIESLCRTTRTTVAGPAGNPFVLLPFQIGFLGRLYARRSDGRRRHRIGMLLVPRKNGKSGLAGGIGLYSLTNEGRGAEILSAAADKEQARIVFAEARRMVEQSPQLDRRIKIFRDVLEDQPTGSVYRCLSSEAFTKEGLNPNVVLYDELHAAPTRELFDVLQLAQGARVDPLLLITSTAGVRTDITGQDSICYQLFNHLVEVASGAVVDPAFYGECWSDGGPIDDDEADRRANPAYDVLVDPEDFQTVKTRTPSAEYYTKRRNLFVATAQHWFDEGVFESLKKKVEIGARPCVLGFDGSWSQDCTALIGCTADGSEHVFTVEVWQRPRDNERWHVPVDAVEEAIRAACSTWNIVEIAADPALWRRQLEDLREEGLPVIEFSQQAASMVEATAGFQQAVVAGTLSHDGDPRLELHVRNCHIEPARGGVKVKKDSKMSSRKIDAAVAAIMCHKRAAFYAERPVPVRGIRIA